MADTAGDRRAAPSDADLPQPILLPPGSGTMLESLAVTHRLTSDQSGGSIYIFESSFEPGDGNRLHVHRDEDEIAYVLEGALEIRLPDRTAVLEAGGLGRLPRRLPHAIRNPLEMTSRYLFLAVPGGLDRWFDAVARASADGSLDEALYRRLSHDHGIDWLE